MFFFICMLLIYTQLHFKIQFSINNYKHMLPTSVTNYFHTSLLWPTIFLLYFTRIMVYGFRYT